MKTSDWVSIHTPKCSSSTHTLSESTPKHPLNISSRRVSRRQCQFKHNSNGFSLAHAVMLAMRKTVGGGLCFGRAAPPSHTTPALMCKYPPPKKREHVLRQIQRRTILITWVQGANTIIGATRTRTVAGKGGETHTHAHTRERARYTALVGRLSFSDCRRAYLIRACNPQPAGLATNLEVTVVHKYPCEFPSQLLKRYCCIMLQRNASSTKKTALSKIVLVKQQCCLAFFSELFLSQHTAA